ncbi:hypothetical protein [Jeotgalibacillus campisalis]|uniref:hypothetical protein n=1 Tax=Jeotgalibacillus campisalis TaxID=220754 RepID=UPI0005978181|nr:hypothetical protein [Jeotgalibacillus campisalis]
MPDVSSKRVCFDCSERIPPETDHFEIDNEVYCDNCVEKVPYTGYQYFLNGEYMGDSDGDGNAEFIDSMNDIYDEDVDEDK